MSVLKVFYPINLANILFLFIEIFVFGLAWHWITLGFMQIEFKLCPWQGMEWVGNRAQAGKYKGPCFYTKNHKLQNCVLDINFFIFKQSFTYIYMLYILFSFYHLKFYLAATFIWNISNNELCLERRKGSCFCINVSKFKK